MFKSSFFCKWCYSPWLIIIKILHRIFFFLLLFVKDFLILFLSLSWRHRGSPNKNKTHLITFCDHDFHSSCPCCISQKKCITSPHPQASSITPSLPHLLCLPGPLVNFALQHFHGWRWLWRARRWAHLPGTMAGGQVKQLPRAPLCGWPLLWTHTHTLINRGTWSHKRMMCFCSNSLARVYQHNLEGVMQHVFSKLGIQISRLCRKNQRGS